MSTKRKLIIAVVVVALVVSVVLIVSSQASADAPASRLPPPGFDPELGVETTEQADFLLGGAGS